MSSKQLVHDWVALRISLGLDFHLEGGQSPSPNSIIFKNAPLIAQWADHNSPRCLFAGLAPMKRPDGGKSFQVVLGLSPPKGCHGKVMYFMRMVREELSIRLLSSDSSVMCGELSSNFVDDVHDQIQHLLLPLIQVQSQKDSVHTKFCSDVSSIMDAYVSSLHGVVNAAGENSQRARPISALPSGAKSADDEFYRPTIYFELPPSLVFVNGNPEWDIPKGVSKVGHAMKNAEFIRAWIVTMEDVLSKANLSVMSRVSDEGPDVLSSYWHAEAKYWEEPMLLLKSPAYRAVLLTCRADRSLNRKWKNVVTSLSQRFARAYDCIKFLKLHSDLISKLHIRCPLDVAPVVLSQFVHAAHASYSMCRYGEETQILTHVFAKTSNRLIEICKFSLQAGQFWKMPRHDAISKLQGCIHLLDQYPRIFKLALEEAAAGYIDQPPPAVNRSIVFARTKLFSDRLKKLQDVTDAHLQFDNATAAGVSGLLGTIEPFTDKFKIFCSKVPDPLNLSDIVLFDEAYVPLLKCVHETELAILKIISRVFGGFQTHENESSVPRCMDVHEALQMLRHLKTVLTRESFQSDFDAKYTLIFYSFGRDIKAVADIYELLKSTPPIPRNITPVAGAIMWCRQLLRRIEDPMHIFQNQRGILRTPESRKVIKLYNRVVRTLLEYEERYRVAWIESVDAYRRGLSSPVLAFKQSSEEQSQNDVVVNLDFDLLQVIKEAKHLQRLGWKVPESALVSMQQRDTLVHSYELLRYIFQRIEVENRSVPHTFVPLFAPIFDALKSQLAPGFHEITWNSVNIVTWVDAVESSMRTIVNLRSKVVETLDTRVSPHIQTLQNMSLVDLGNDTFTTESFMSHIKKITIANARRMNAMNLEVEDGINFILSEIITVAKAVCTPFQVVSILHDASSTKTKYSRVIYAAVLSAIRNSFNVIKDKLKQNTQSVTFLDSIVEVKPLFVVEVTLVAPNIKIRPSIKEIQNAINQSALAILSGSRRILHWSDVGARTEDRENNIYDQVGQDLEIVKLVLVLCGSFEGMKATVDQYLESLTSQKKLWKDDPATDVNAFADKTPKVPEFHGIIAHFDVMREINEGIPAERIIGPLLLKTAPFRQSVEAHIGLWLQQYGRLLYKIVRAQYSDNSSWTDKATADLQPIQGYISQNMKYPLDLKQMVQIMQLLGAIKLLQASEDMTFKPAEIGFAMLSLFGVPVPREELQQLVDLRQKWIELCHLCTEVSEHLRHRESEFKRELRDFSRKFTSDAVFFRADFVNKGPIVPGISIPMATDRLKKFRLLYEEKNDLYKTCTNAERVFGFTPTVNLDVEKTGEEIRLLSLLYDVYSEVDSANSGLMQMNVSEISSRCESLIKSFGDFDVHSRKLPKVLRDWDAYIQMRSSIELALSILPICQRLLSAVVCDRHWVTVSQILGAECNPKLPTFKMNHFMKLDIEGRMGDLEGVVQLATKEAEMGSKLSKIASDWLMQPLVLAAFKARPNMVLKGAETQEMVEKLEETQLILVSMMTSRYVGHIKNELQDWSSKLERLNDTIDAWVTVQGMWIYLEAVFSSGDIARQLPQEAKRFSQVDKQLTGIMSRANDVGRVIEFVNGFDELIKTFQIMTSQLESCQRSLAGYLEQKRALFPRFYFVSDPVILEILSQSTDPTAIQAHLPSLFDNIAQITFNPNFAKQVVAIHSAEGEALSLTEPVLADGNIESWLVNLEQEARMSVIDAVAACANRLPISNSREHIFGQISQVAHLGVQMDWTNRVMEALKQTNHDKYALAKASEAVAKFLEELTELAMSQLPSLVRARLETIITIQVNLRDASEDLAKKKIKSDRDFEWLRRARFIFQENCQICLADVSFHYGGEFLGCRDRLVVTPLTDRCYVTLTQALSMYLGGAPAGPAGTGKTETVKDLGRLLGMFVVVFNCSDQMDFRALGKIYKGLAQSGAWGCMDEFNRIELPVLSVVSQQVQCVLTAVREGRSSFVFTDGTTSHLHSDVGLFITMNPGYAGRQELPENLKMLFRGVTMMVPDRQIIIKVKLASAGFKQAAPLSKKFHVLYRLCEQQLSKQGHYDFGLRNILSVLRTAGTAKQLNPRDDEPAMMMRLLRDMNLSKFVAEDVPLFLALLNDLFPDMRIENARNERLERELAKRMEERFLLPHEDWTRKIHEMHALLVVRHGVMIVGPPCVGKTASIGVLRDALSVVNEMPHKDVRMNPKSISASQMFGRLDSMTNDWHDGIFSALWRKHMKIKNYVSWIILDGPVDAIWIENLNTVLDDNKLLTLANGDRIQMSNLARLLFEVENLNNASPATVSRAGIVFMSRECLGWKPLVKAWMFQLRQHEKNIQQQRMVEQQDQQEQQKQQELETMPDQCHEVLQELLNKIFRILEVFEEKSYGDTYFCDVTFASRVSQSLQLLQRLIDDARRDAAIAGETLKWDELIPVTVYFAVTWGVGGAYTETTRNQATSLLQEQAIAPLLTRDDGRSYIASAYDGHFTYQGSYASWASLMPTWTLPASARPGSCPFSQLVVPTSESIRISFILKRMILHGGGGVMLVGDRGTAKTKNIEMFISDNGESESWTTRTIGFSSTSSIPSMQAALEGWIEKRQGRTFGPLSGKKMIVFVDDISMPNMNEWGDQPTNEFTRQLVEMCGCYNLERAGEWKSIVDLHWVAAMPRPSSSSNDLPPRLKRHFMVIGVPMPSQRVILRVFGSILDAWAALNNVPAPVQAVLSTLPAATYSLLLAVQEKLLPTPAKFHYAFNIRDISRVFQGVMHIDGETQLKSSGIALNLWLNECCSVFGDRLCSVADLKTFEGALLTSALGSMSTLPAGAGPINQAVADMRQTFWVDFLRESNDSDEDLPPLRIYEQCNEIERVRARLLDLMKAHNAIPANRGVVLNLVLFDDAIRHIVKMTRLLALERGNALVVGVGGSGKQSLARMAAFVARCSCCSIRAAPGYTVNSFIEDIKRLFKDTGVDGKSTALLMTETDLKDDSFMEIMNSMLTTCNVPGLFSREEMEALHGEVRARASLDRVLIGETAHDAQTYYQLRVMQNFHIVLTFSPVGSNFRSRSRAYPGLISGCSIDWFFPWPEEALAAVASKKLQTFCSDPSLPLSQAVQNGLVKCFSSSHSLMIANAEMFWSTCRRRVHFTPKTFLCMLDQFCEFYKNHLDSNNSDSQKIRNGLQKLLNATEDVSNLRVSLKESEKLLGVARAKTGELLKSITAAAEIAATKTKECEAVATKIEQEADVVKADKDDTQKDLETAQPALDAAIEALSSITTKDIQTLKKLQKPPELIKRIFDGVLILKQRPVIPWRIAVVGDKKVCENSYTISLKMMDERDFVESLLNFEKDAITEETVELLMPYLDMPDFNFEAGKKASGNVAGLCSWVRAMCTYFEVSRFVKPKIEALAVAEAKLKVATARLTKARAELKEQEAELASMHAKLDAAMEEKQKIEDSADQTRKKCDTADALILGLSGERVRWTQQIAEFDAIILRLAGDMCICSAAVSYFGPFNAEFRDKLSSLLLKSVNDARLPYTPGVSMVAALCNDVLSGEWSINGLPPDALSVENGIIVTTANRYPLLIDPQEQGKKWIQKQFAISVEGPLVTCGVKDKRVMSHLEQCMSNGNALLLDGVNEALEATFDALLCKSFTRSGNMISVLIGGKDCDIHPDFKLFMVTKLSNPEFSPEFCANTAVVNFNVTLLGLENQLLSRIIGLERAELEDQRKMLLMELTNGSQKIKELQDDLLNRLASTQGSLLEDDSLVSVLTVTKDTVKDIQDKVATVNVTQAQISSTREEYRPVARRGAVMYGSVIDIGSLNPMYQSSLNQFLELFDRSVAVAPFGQSTKARVDNIMSCLTLIVFKAISRGLFNEHKNLFGLTTALKISMSLGHCEPMDVNALLTVSFGSKSKDNVSHSKVPWLKTEQWQRLEDAQCLCPNVRCAMDSMVADFAQWKEWVSGDDLERRIPSYTSKSPLIDLIVIRCVREDRTIQAVTVAIERILGAEYTQVGVIDFIAVASEVVPTTPIVFLLSPGADPSQQIEAAARKKRIKLAIVSMGQGQEVIAKSAISASRASGGWVLLQNGHLGLPLMVEVVALLDSSDGGELSSDFRLWITTPPHPDFPISLLHRAIKITNQPPTGLQAGMRRTLQSMTQDYFETVSMPEWQPLILAMCFLHSLVQERRKYGPLGWNVPYEFNNSDLNASLMFLQKHMTSAESYRQSPSWNAIRYMVCEVQYGGRVTDDFDRRLLGTLGERYFKEQTMKLGNSEYPRGYCPKSLVDIAAARLFVESLPHDDLPEVFGLHSNAELSINMINSGKMFADFVEIQPKDSAASGSLNFDDVVLACASDLVRTMPQDFSSNQFDAYKKKFGAAKPLNVFLGQEIELLQRVQSLVKQALADVKLAIEGSIALSPTLNDTMMCFSMGKVPPSWSKCSWPSPNLKVWFESLLSRSAQLRSWLSNGRPTVYWMSGFFNPQGFLTAMKQEIARRHQGWALDDVEITTDITRWSTPEDVKEAPMDGGVYVHGLFLEGADWDARGQKLQDLRPGIISVSLPVAHISAVLSSERHNDSIVYNAPVYRAPSRTDRNFIFEMVSSTRSNFQSSRVHLMGFPGNSH